MNNPSQQNFHSQQGVICRNCSSVVQPGFRFCNVCGSPVSVQPGNNFTTANATQVVNPPPPSNQTMVTNKSRAGRAWIVGLGLVIGFFILGGILLLGSSLLNDSSSNNRSQPVQSKSVVRAEATPTLIETPTNEPIPTGFATQQPQESIVIDSAPTEDPNPPLRLPFVDRFDDGIDPSWRVINGKPLISDGWLTSASETLVMEIGNSDLASYVLEFDLSNTNTYCNRGEFSINISPTVRALVDLFWGNTWKWQWYEDDEWHDINMVRDLECGRYEITIDGANYQVFVNGQIVKEQVFEPVHGPLILTIDDRILIDNLSIKE